MKPNAFMDDNGIEDVIAILEPLLPSCEPEDILD